MAKVFNYEKKIYSQSVGQPLALFNAGIPKILPSEIYHIKGKVIDVGCGAGFIPGKILKPRLPEADIYGVDISKNAIAKAKKDFPNVTFKLANAYQLPFPNNYFDAVLMNCTLEHLEYPSKALQEVLRVLKKQGLFLSATPIEGDRLVFFQNKKLTKKYHGHLQRFDRHTLLRLIKESGFRIRRHYFTGYIFCQAISGIYLRIFKFLHKPSDFQIKSPKLNPCKYLINFLINIESEIIPNNIPGLYMHIISQKV